MFWSIWGLFAQIIAALMVYGIANYFIQLAFGVKSK